MPVAKPRPIRKADKKPMAAAYDQSGKLIGLVDPDKITPVADLSAPEADLDPVPPAEVGTAADAVGKSQAPLGELRKRMYRSTDVTEQERIHAQLGTAAATALRVIHSRGAA